MVLGTYLWSGHDGSAERSIDKKAANWVLWTQTSATASPSLTGRGSRSAGAGARRTGPSSGRSANGWTQVIEKRRQCEIGEGASQIIQLFGQILAFLRSRPAPSAANQPAPAVAVSLAAVCSVGAPGVSRLWRIRWSSRLTLWSCPVRSSGSRS